jgi:6-pyruvoyl-tetrahydropterin synthase
MRAEIEKSFDVTCEHELPNYKQCASQHEHKYKIIISVHAWVNEDTGMIIDLNDLDEIIAKYNGKNLNDLMELPTVEHFAMAIANDTVTKLEHYSRITVTVMESENTKVVVTR